MGAKSYSKKKHLIGLLSVQKAILCWKGRPSRGNPVAPVFPRVYGLDHSNINGLGASSGGRREEGFRAQLSRRKTQYGSEEGAGSTPGNMLGG